jgi:competence ComEA-like helix-hairpin-helix protein
MSEPLDINSASKEEIDSVEGLAGHGHEIVRYREERGRFTSLRQLDEVPGMAGKVDQEIRKRLRVQA